MTEEQNINSLIQNLNERTKELNCIYSVDEVLNDFDSDIETVLHKIVEIIPHGWRFTDICKAKIVFEQTTIESAGYKDTELKLSSPILIDNKASGEVSIVYIKPIKTEKRIFLSEEVSLLNTIALKLNNFFLLKRLRKTIKEMETRHNEIPSPKEEALYHWLKELHLSDEEIDNFLHVRIHFKKGETMCKQGSLTSYTMLLSEGLAKNYLEGAQERGFNFSIVKPYDFIGLSSLYGKAVYNFSGAALTPCTVYIIENTLFQQTIANNSHFAQYLFHWYCRTTERHLKRLSCIANKQSLGRMAEILLYLKQDIFNSPVIKGFISRKDIAELAALSTESAVRILSELKKDKIIHVLNNNDIEIIDEKLLKTLSLAG